MIILKYQFKPADYYIDIATPPRTEFLTAAMQGEMISVWAEISDLEPPNMERWRLMSVGTGFHVPDGSAFYIGTCFDGPYVWHIYAKPVL